MNTANIYNKLRAFIRIDGRGIIIPGSVQFRKDMPKQGIWKELTLSECCNSTGDAILTILNNATNSITGVKIGGVDYSNVIANGEMFSYILPRGYNQTITITYDYSVDVAWTVTVNTSTGDLTPNTGVSDDGEIVLTSTSTPNAQYLVTLVDD